MYNSVRNLNRNNLGGQPFGANVPNNYSGAGNNFAPDPRNNVPPSGFDQAYRAGNHNNVAPVNNGYPQNGIQGQFAQAPAPAFSQQRPSNYNNNAQSPVGGGQFNQGFGNQGFGANNANSNLGGFPPVNTQAEFNNSPAMPSSGVTQQPSRPFNSYYANARSGVRPQPQQYNSNNQPQFFSGATPNPEIAGPNNFGYNAPNPFQGQEGDYQQFNNQAPVNQPAYPSAPQAGYNNAPAGYQKNGAFRPQNTSRFANNVPPVGNSNFAGPSSNFSQGYQQPQQQPIAPAGNRLQQGQFNNAPNQQQWQQPVHPGQPPYYNPYHNG